MIQVEAECMKEAEEKKAALQRVAELEAAIGEKTVSEAAIQELTKQLNAEVADLSRQLQVADAGRQTQEEETKELRRKADELEAKNSQFLSSGAAAEERQKQLEVRVRSSASGKGSACVLKPCGISPACFRTSC